MIRFPRTTRYTPVATETVASLSHPDCPGGGVAFVVYQTSVESAFSNRATARTTGAARCAATGAELPVMGWTDEMERAFEGVQARARLAPTSYAVKPQIKRAFAAAFVACTLLGVFAWFSTSSFVGGLEEADARVAAVAAAPAAGDMVLAFDPDASDTRAAEPVTLYRWWIVRAVTDESVELQADSAPVEFDAGVPRRNPELFTGPTVSVPRDGFLQDGWMDVGETSVPVSNASERASEAV